METLRPLSEHEDYRFGEGSYDVRNWKVRTRVDDHEVGKVHDVLLDENGQARFLDIDVKGGPHVLVPSGDTRVDPTDKVVHVSGLDRTGFDTLPEYEHRPETITPEYSSSLTTAYDSAYNREHHYDRADYAAGWTPRTEREHSGTLARLDELDDVDVASHEPDPRGWDVIGAEGERVGKVDHVIGDTGAMKARYLAVELDRDFAGDDRHVLVPVGHVDLDTSRNRVRSAALHTERARDLPAYRGETIDRDYEDNLMRRYNEAYFGERRYEHPRYRSDVLRAERGESAR